jgi:dihydrofolate reductase
MRKLRVIEFLSLDGVMQSPHAVDDTEGGFQHGGWHTYSDKVLASAAMEGMAETDTYLFGRKTYEELAAHWPTVPDDDPMACHLNNTAKLVASRTLQHLDWRNSTLIEGDVAGEVGTLKAQSGKNIAVLGSGDLVQTLIEHDLVDEYFLGVFPLVLGSGKRLFREYDQVRRLSLVDSQPTTTGGLLLTYRSA